ncbi:hypothetical protein M1L60_15185 [Actinoplanes sp. TRM 88003]|uniref:Uncharacterized protein n=1 Tax=Paractinoplanes aksuensis TaxID=2939490 RepID=A0ABT1DM74_9ACTN|nr:hypothetical protein [Actinoplanes aksuensis]MCO8271937.1 hypothetical protein [Actinoplanes aksuensis]
MHETAVQVLSAREPIDAQRARWELRAMAGRLRSMEAKLVDERRISAKLRRERDRLRDGRSLWQRWFPALFRTPPRAPAVQRAPACLYVVIGLEFEPLREFVLTLRQRVQIEPGHRPVVLTDCSSFALLRDLGVLLEYLPDRETWEHHRPDRSWEDVLSERLSRLYRDHGTVRTIFVNRAHPPTLSELLR